MAQPSNSAAPSLLALTAPPPRKPTAAPEPGFDEQLNAAADASARPASSPDDVKESTPRDDTPPQGAESRDDSASAEPDAVDGSDRNADSTDADESADESLVAVLPATETIVAETHPDAILPLEASTAIDVGAGAGGLLTPTDGVALEDANGALGTTAPNAAGVAVVDPSATTRSTAPAPEELDNAQQGEAATVDGVAELVDSDGAGSDSDASQRGAGVARQAEANADAKNAIGSEASTAAPTETADPLADTTAPAANTAANESVSPSATDTDAAATPPPLVANATASAAAPPFDETDADAASAKTTEAEAPPAAGPTRAEGRERFAEAFRAAGPDRTTTVNPARFVSRVARAIDFAQQRGGGPIEIRLSPPELGALRVQIELKEGVLTASLEAETPAARSTLLDNLPALRDRLEQQQIRIEKFDVDVRDDSRGDQPEGRQPEGRQQEERRDSERPAEERPARSLTGEPREAAAPEVHRPATIHFGADEINFVA